MPSTPELDRIRLIAERGADGGHGLIVLAHQLRKQGRERATGRVPQHFYRTQQAGCTLELTERANPPHKHPQTQPAAQPVVEPEFDLEIGALKLHGLNRVTPAP